MSEILVVSHQIHLTREQRYALHNKEPIETVGISVPIWHYQGETSEPGIEVFCEYYLTNDDEMARVSYLKRGYHINLPQIPAFFVPAIPPSDEDWRYMSIRQQEEYYYRNEPPVNSLNLLDIQDRGGGGFLGFVTNDKFIKNKRLVEVVHEVQISSIEKLQESLI